jgi:predicted RecB family nuclease
MNRLLSASRLNAFQSCRHQTTLWLSGVKPPERGDDTTALLRRKGFEHEAVVLQRLVEEHGPAVEIETDVDLTERVNQTREAMKAGAPLIYQAALANERWMGLPDFLIRADQDPSGRWRYLPEDAKLAKKGKASHLVQLGIYGSLVEHETGSYPSNGTIHGSGPVPDAFKLVETRHIVRRMMGHFEQFIDAPEPTRPVKTAACGQCDFVELCTATWRAEDSPTFVAGIRGDQIIKLERAGVRTMSELAGLDDGAEVKGIGRETLAKLVAQARLQKQGATEGRAIAELLPSQPLRGFAILPPPAPGDLFYDIEGDPLFPEGLEYLHGLWGPLGDTDANQFVPLWSHSHDEEKVAFERLIDLFVSHLRRYPQAHIYHYAMYEQTALKRLAMRYATREAELDQLLRDKSFVDLYAVIKSGVRASTESYSLKDLEKIYWGGRAGEVTNAGDSIVEYERWRELSEPAILESIERYNEDDCVSTQMLRDWLEGLRPTDAPYGLAIAIDAPAEKTDSEEREQFERDRRELAQALRDQEALEEPLRELIAELLWFHQRSQKPQWWAIFDRQTWTDEELIEDPESLGALTLEGQGLDKRSIEATFRFPLQDTKLKVGDQVRLALESNSAGKVTDLDLDNGVVTVRRGKDSGEFPQTCSLTPGSLIGQGVLEGSVFSFAKRVAVGDLETDRALLDLLRRTPPRMAGRVFGAAVLTEGKDLVAGATQAVRDLDNSALIIQGPPGTGKTYTTARAIVTLLEDGKRVAVSSNSHKAINNLLSAISKRAEEIGFDLKAVKKSSASSLDSVLNCYGVESHNSLKLDVRYHLLGATAYELATHPLNELDYLFVDEAGQVSLGNLAAMAPCARNLVLVGDQMQLPQPVQGVHPGESGLSSMDYAMQAHATVPPDRGILLNVSWRMHPDVCGFISDAIYDGRLTAHPSTSNQYIEVEPPASPLARTGVQYLALDHEGCTQSSLEEANAARTLIEQLRKMRWTNEKGESHPITQQDILVVTPFNMQVSLLNRALPTGTRIGTVDKFQGQEAPVVIVSMATSFGGDAPRGTEFLFNRNRLNVAISRAKCLAIIICGKRLMDLPEPGLADLPRLDLLARLEAATACPDLEILTSPLS